MIRRRAIPRAHERRARRHHAALALWLLAVSAPGVAATPPSGRPGEADTPAATAVEHEWLRVLLAGRRIGHLEVARRVDGETIETTESLAIVLERDGRAVPLTTRTVSIETLSGEPLGFRAETRMSGAGQTVEGRVIDGREAQIRLESAAGAESRRIDWAPGAVLVAGAERIAREQPLVAGTRWRHVSFDPGSLLFIPVESEILGRETIRIDGEARSLVRLRQTARMPGADLTVDGWHADDHRLVRALMPMFGLELELVACATDCSREPIQSLDLFDHTLVASPRPLSATERRRALRHLLRAPEGAGRPAAAAGQRVESIPGGFRVTVDPVGWRGGGGPPTEADTKANRWLESDDPAIRRAAREAIGDAAGAQARMRRLARWVRDHIDEKTLDVGYASARETLDARAGDCTEHAVLLAALARALGIPARVVSGLAYAPRWAGRDHVFVPHAWVEAWTGERWEGFDAALPEGFGAGHVALASGDGEPSGFFGAVGLLGNLDIQSIDAESSTP